MANERRIKLHNELLQFCDNVYFQPPESVKLKYPCIIYKKKSVDTQYANNVVYLYRQGYDGTLIERDPDSEVLKAMSTSFEYFKVASCFATENLYHSNFTIYY